MAKNLMIKIGFLLPPNLPSESPSGAEGDDFASGAEGDDFASGAGEAMEEGWAPPPGSRGPWGIHAGSRGRGLKYCKTWGPEH